MTRELLSFPRWVRFKKGPSHHKKTQNRFATASAATPRHLDRLGDGEGEDEKPSKVDGCGFCLWSQVVRKGIFRS